MKSFAPIRVLALTAATLATASTAIAQHGGIPGGMGGRGMSMPGGGMPGGGMPERGGMHGGGTPSLRGRARLTPAGRWWDDKKVARSLGLKDSQQRRMDSVFSQNRDALLSRYENLQQEQSRLDTLVHSDHPSETALSAQIDRVAQARADLGKAYAHMQLQLRDEMSPDQLNKLDAENPSRP